MRERKRGAKSKHSYFSLASEAVRTPAALPVGDPSNNPVGTIARRETIVSSFAMIVQCALNASLWLRSKDCSMRTLHSQRIPVASLTNLALAVVAVVAVDVVSAFIVVVANAVAAIVALKAFCALQTRAHARTADVVEAESLLFHAFRALPAPLGWRDDVVLNL